MGSRGNRELLPVEVVAGSRKSLSSISASGSAPAAQKAAVGGQRPPLPDPGLSPAAVLAKTASVCVAGDGPARAPQWMESIVALAVTSARTSGPQSDFAGSQSTHPSPGGRKRPVGTETDPGGAGQAGLQGVGEDRRQVYARCPPWAGVARQAHQSLGQRLPCGPPPPTHAEARQGTETIAQAVLGGLYHVYDLAA